MGAGRASHRHLPDCLPILGPGLFGSRRQVFGPRTPDAVPGPPPSPAELPLPVLLARVLLGYTIRFEQRSALSLPVCANLLRLLDEAGVQVRDLPARSGVSITPGRRPPRRRHKVAQPRILG